MMLKNKPLTAKNTNKETKKLHLTNQTKPGLVVISYDIWPGSQIGFILKKTQCLEPIE